jgi:hypothetical protein
MLSCRLVVLQASELKKCHCDMPYQSIGFLLLDYGSKIAIAVMPEMGKSRPPYYCI